MSEGIKQMLRERESADRAHEEGLRRELNRRIGATAKAKFIAAFQRQQRYERARHNPALPLLPIETQAVCEAVNLALDPGWDAERAWRYSETRERAISEVEAELARRRV